jgi:hypothetical protein
MTTVPYVILQDSSGSGGQFAVVQGGYRPVVERGSTFNKTVQGTADIAQGPNYEKHEYMIRCRDSEDRPEYGTIHELERLWRLNNPIGAVTDRITLVDHFGVSHTAVFVGEFPRPAISTVLDGSGGWYFVPVTLLFVT